MVAECPRLASLLARRCVCRGAETEGAREENGGAKLFATAMFDHSLGLRMGHEQRMLQVNCPSCHPRAPGITSTAAPEAPTASRKGKAAKLFTTTQPPSTTKCFLGSRDRTKTTEASSNQLHRARAPLQRKEPKGHLPHQLEEAMLYSEEGGKETGRGSRGPRKTPRFPSRSACTSHGVMEATLNPASLML